MHKTIITFPVGLCLIGIGAYIQISAKEYLDFLSDNYLNTPIFIIILGNIYVYIYIFKYCTCLLLLFIIITYVFTLTIIASETSLWPGLSVFCRSVRLSVVHWFVVCLYVIIS